MRKGRAPVTMTVSSSSAARSPGVGGNWRRRGSGAGAGGVDYGGGFAELEELEGSAFHHDLVVVWSWTVMERSLR